MLFEVNISCLSSLLLICQDSELLINVFAKELTINDKQVQKMD